MAAGSHRVVSRSGGGHSAATFFPTIMFFLLLCIASTVVADTCWGLDGRTMVNNRKCPGSNACCGEKATCLSNRLCHNQGDPPDLWVRGPCFINGWDENTDCAQICLYNETLTNRFPRVTQCEDGSLCCDDNKDCCAEGKGVFLDETGNRVSARATGVTLSWPPGFSITSTSTSSTPTSSAITTTSSGTSSPSSAQTAATTPSTGSESSSTDSPAENAESSSSSDMVGLKVGLGLGIPLAVLVSGLLVYCFLKRRNAAASGQGEKDGYGYQSTIGGAPPSEMHGDASYISEAPPNYKPGYVYSGGGGMTTVKTLNANSYPVELGNHMSTELDANNSVGAQPPQRYYEMA